MTPTTLDEIEARAKAATPGPWKADLDVFDPDEHEIEACVSNEGVTILATLSTGIRLHEDAPGAHAKLWGQAGESQELKDAAFIAHARTDVWLPGSSSPRCARRGGSGTR